MENPSKSDPFLALLEEHEREGSIESKYASTLKGFYLGYKQAIQDPSSSASALFIRFLKLIEEQIKAPFQFEPFHKLIRTPFDYYQLGLDLIGPLIDHPHSSVTGLEQIERASELIKQGHNVAFLSNHQTEADPQAISLLLQDSYPKFAEAMIFVAGERVITDPLAIPFSMGRNLLCIYSKRYIDNPPELKAQKQLHNKRTMQLMSTLLSEGGKAIYVAPSGGRDRPNPQGIFEVAPFDSSSIQMFYLMAKRADSPTHFFPLTLKTHALLPPPETIQMELGETRVTKRAPIHLAVGPEIDMEHFPGSETKDKCAQRTARAEYIHSLVCQTYAKFS